MTLDTTYPEVMTLKQTANYLQVAERSVLKMAQEGAIPSAKIASQWRFLKPLLNDWLAFQMQHHPSKTIAPPDISPAELETISLSDLIHPDWMHLHLKPGPKTLVLRALVEQVEAHGGLSNPVEFRNLLLSRERLYSTAIGSGIAIPHPRQPAPELLSGGPGIAFGRCPEGTDFDSLDKEPTFLFFMIFAPREDLHLRLISRVARLMGREETIEDLKKAETPSEVLEIVTVAEEAVVGAAATNQKGKEAS